MSLQSRQHDLNARYAALRDEFLAIQKQPIASLAIGQYVVYEGSAVWEVISPARLRAVPHDLSYTGHLKILRLTKATLVTPISMAMVEKGRILQDEQEKLNKEKYL